jgi:replicative DNA helicase
MFSLEMTSERLMDKVICSLANISHSDYKSGRLMDQQKKAAEDSLGIINHWSVTLNDQMVVDIDKVHAMCRKIKDVKGLDLVVIDYLQLLRTKDRVGNREQEISNISRKAKMLAVDLNIPVLLLSQLNRGLEQRSDKRPMLSDLRESGAIEQDADVVLFIYRDYEYHENAPPDAGELIIAKHREGERGIIDFKFNMEMTRFSEEEDLDMDMYINESKPF